MNQLPFTKIFVAVVALLLVLLARTAASTTKQQQPPSPFTPNDHHQFCVIGGGPAGIQAAYFMHKYKMDYVVFERSDGPGSFFKKYPRQRNLISINKVHTGTNDTEFNLRHDWNSLLNGPDDFFFPRHEQQQEEEEKPLLFAQISKEYYPKADTVPQYLDKFLQKYPDLHIVFNADVSRIARKDTPKKSSSSASLFKLEVKQKNKGNNDDGLSVITCDVIVLATGKAVERRVKLNEGSHLVTSYTDAPTDPEAYNDQEVLLLGAGNSAFELARSIEDNTALVHIASRNPIQMAHQTHYVGDVRAVNLGFLDRYQLKSMDVLMTLSAPDLKYGRLYRDARTKKIMLRQDSGGDEEGEELAAQNKAEKDIVDSATKRARDAEEALVREAAKELFPSRRGYHRVISCLGFTWNNTPFAFSKQLQRDETRREKCAEGGDFCDVDDSDDEATAVADGKEVKDDGDDGFGPVTPMTDSADAFLEIASNFESVNVPDLFVAGALSHFRDFKRSAGGFIHGFRYTVRTTVAMLRERYTPESDLQKQEFAYPFLELTTRKEVLERFMFRLKNVSSLYQMQGHLCDVVVVEISSPPAADSNVAADDGREKRKVFRYYQDLPLDMIKSKTPFRVSIDMFKKETLHFLTLSLEFGKDFQGVGTIYHQAQKETYKRRAEKMLWDPMQPTADPDFRLHHSRLHGASQPLQKLHKVTAAELLMRDDDAKMRRQRRAGGDVIDPTQQQRQMSGYMPASPGKTSLLEPLEDPPSMLPPANGRPPKLSRFLFLHPVIREWKRTPSAENKNNNGRVRIPSVKHQLIRELRLHEDVLNDFTGKHYHETPVKKFLEKSLP